jgi:hypothetical protein
VSMRPMIYPVSAVEPLRRAYGSHDEALINRIVDEESRHEKLEQASSEVDKFRDLARRFVEGRLDDEQGRWKANLYRLARGLGLLQTEYPINEDWKWMARCDYHAEVVSQLPEDARQLLTWLVEGRPLKEEAIVADGCYYAWLDKDEIKQLHTAISALEVSEESMGELMEFHEELLSWLDACRGKALLLTAM